MKSAVHVPYAGWLILSCTVLARTRDFKNFLSSIQVFCCQIFTMLWYDVSYRCLCVQSSMTSPLHHVSYRLLSVCICLQAPVSLSGFIFLHLILCCLSSYCIPHAIIKGRITILISYFPYLAARFFPCELLDSSPTLPFQIHQSAYQWMIVTQIQQRLLYQHATKRQ